jgi:acyl-CoA synthetase (AMP-forming)/AMP-acid ligase II
MWRATSRHQGHRIHVDDKGGQLMRAIADPTVASLIRATFRRYSSKTAIQTEEGDKISFTHLQNRVHRLVNGLTDGLGLKLGDRVAVLADNRAEYIELDFACALAGLVKVPLYMRNAAPEHLYFIENSDAIALVAEPQTLGPLLEVMNGDWGPLTNRVLSLDTVPADAVGVKSYESLIAAASPRKTMIDVAPDDYYQIRYTSGTTGRPKGAATDHRGMLAATLGNVTFHSLECAVGPNDVVGHVMPFSHASAFNLAGHSWMGTTHLPISRWDPDRYMRHVRDDGVSISMMAPTMIAMMVNESETLGTVDTSNLRTISYGGAPIAETVLERALESFGSIFTQGYGSTETPSMVVYLEKRDHILGSTRLQSCGLPCSWADVDVFRPDATTCDPGEIGEIWTRSPSALREYVKNPEATAAATEHGWYHSGDMALRDEEGYFFLKDRKNDMIISGGFNIYPAEVENVLMKHPSVIECAVVPTPDEQWGEVVSAVVRLRPGMEASAEDLEAHCQQSIGSYKRPRRIAFTDEPLPKSAVDKMLRRVAREQYFPNENTP